MMCPAISRSGVHVVLKLLRGRSDEFESKHMDHAALLLERVGHRISWEISGSSVRLSPKLSQILVPQLNPGGYRW